MQLPSIVQKPTKADMMNRDSD